MTLTAGFDIGGAHLKIALVNGGRMILARQIVCPLWRGIDHLDAALTEARALTVGATRHAITMTGELADVFPDRYTGVARIIERSVAALGSDINVWMGCRGFGTAAEAEENWVDTSSANCLATAALAARVARDGVLIDIGSTTTDIIAFRNGTVAARATTDADRLRTGELVYTGLTRTPVAMVTQRGLFKGEWQGLARETFATMADVRRVLGTLPEGADQHATADGRGTSAAESRARLARMFGRDAEPGEEADWELAARIIADEQLRVVEAGLRAVIGSAGAGPAVVAGIGAAEAAEVAARAGWKAITFGQRIGASVDMQYSATAYAPAVAVAMLSESA